MPLETIYVVAGNAVYSEWETVVIEHDIRAGHANFLLTTTEVTPIGANSQAAFDKWHFPPGTFVDIYANEDIVITGFVYQYAPAADAEQHSITIYGKTASFNYEISSIRAKAGGTYEDTTIMEVIKEWAQAAGVFVQFYADATPLQHWQIRQGATGYEEGLRLLKPHGLMQFGLMNGSIAVSDGRALGVQGPIVQGENILRMQAKLTDANFDHTLAIGQTNFGTRLKENLQPGAQAQTAYGNRRTKIIVEPALIDMQRALTRAQWEQRRAVDATMQAVVTVPGWHAPWGDSYLQENVAVGARQENMGPLWGVGYDTYLYAPWLKINCVMRCSKIVFKQSQAEGSTTELTLVDQKAAYGSTPAICQNGSMWDVPFDFGDYMPGFNNPIPQFVDWFKQHGGQMSED